MDSVESGKACGSDTAHMSIFGYNPFVYYKGRGAFETMGCGVDMIPGDIAFKCNFATMDIETGIVTKRRCDRKFPQWGLQLIQDLDNIKIPGHEQFYSVKIQYATEHRVGIRVRGPHLVDTITSTDPLVDGKKLKRIRGKNNDFESNFTAGLINLLSDTIIQALTNHPINIQRKNEGKKYTNVILLRGCGSRIQCDSFEQKYNLKSFILAPTAIISGIGMTFGMDRITGIEGATGDASTNLQNKGKTAVDNLLNNPYNFGFLHIKGFDDLGHDMDIQGREAFLQKIDTMLGEVIQQLTDSKQRFLIVITGDHTTTCYTGDHTFEPVPFVISPINFQFNLKQFSDQVTKFDEISCSQGRLGRFAGNQVMNVIQKIKKVYT